jgi:flagellar hook-associated protein 1 FlgK
MANILSTANSGLIAAQAGLATTGHNIANSATPGFSRQVVVQAAIGGQNEGGGFIGKGTVIILVKRQYSEYLGDQLRTINTAQGQLNSHYTEISRINNLLADPSSGLAPVLQDFFKGVQALAGNTSANPSRQGMLASAESLAGRFQALDGQLKEMRDAVNTQITTSISSINSYAQQIASLNEAIGKAQNAADGQPPNDLLDQRDHLVSELSKEVQVTVVKESVNYNIFIGNGQPMVLGSTPGQLQPIASPNDLAQMEVGYKAGSGKVVMLAESGLPGGKLGGLFEFRAKSLTPAENSLGRIALGLANTFNAQHALGQDQTGAMGGKFFYEAKPVVNPSSFNKGVPVGSPATLDASIANVSALTTSNYSFTRDSAGTYVITRLSDNVDVYSNTALPAAPVDGINFNVTGTMANGDNYIVKPTVNGAASFSVLVKDQAQIAAAAPIKTEYTTTNTGTGAISDGSVDKNFTTGTVSPPVTLAYHSAGSVTPAVGAIVNNGGATVSATLAPPATPTGSDYRLSFAGGNYTITRLSDNASVYSNPTPPAAPIDGMNFNVTGAMAAGDSFLVSADTLTGFPSTLPVTVTNNGVTATYPAGAPVAYTPGATITFGGVSIKITGAPANNDTFTIGPNPSAASDNRNMLLLGALQTANTLGGPANTPVGVGSTTFQGAFGQLVAQIGNKTHELEVTKEAEGKLLSQVTQAQQAESGVNLDEEATNLIRYQQAYQAAAKVMQTVKEMFDVLAALGR